MVHSKKSMARKNREKRAETKPKLVVCRRLVASFSRSARPSSSRADPSVPYGDRSLSHRDANIAADRYSRPSGFCLFCLFCLFDEPLTRSSGNSGIEIRKIWKIWEIERTELDALRETGSRDVIIVMPNPVR